MNWRRNSAKVDAIAEHGQTSGLPLFDATTANVARTVPPHMPNQVYDASGAKAAAMQRLKESGRLPESRFLVLEAIFQLHVATDREIGNRLQWEINRVTPRRKELQALGLVQPAGEKPGVYGAMNTLWKVDERALILFLE